MSESHLRTYKSAARDDASAATPARALRLMSRRRAGGVVHGFLDHSPVERGEVPVALRECLRVRHRARVVSLVLPGKRQQAVPHFEVHLADDV